MKKILQQRFIVADKSVEMTNKGTVKVETPNGTFVIYSKQGLDEKGRSYDEVLAYPVNHPGKKKVLTKKTKNSIRLVQCKTVKL